MKLKSSMAVLCLIISSQNPGTSKSSRTGQGMERSKVYTQEYLNALPESSYALKPTPEMQSFAGQNLYMASLIRKQYGWLLIARFIIRKTSISMAV
jgi:hypothetical protein